MEALGSLAPYDVQEEDWSRRVEELADPILVTSADGMTLVSPDDAAVLAWFDRWAPRCI
jgi:hypothetical protein